MSEVSNKRFVHFDGTKEEFIAGGYPSTYTDSIVFINGDGNESNNTIYTHGEYYGQGVIVEGDASNNAVLKNSNNTASGSYSIALGCNNTASGTCSHAEGYGSTSILNHFTIDELDVYTDYSSDKFTETKNKIYDKYKSLINNSSSDSGENLFSVAFAIGSHTEGRNSIALNERAHAEGLDNIAYGLNSHVENSRNEAYGNNSHAEGNKTLAMGNMSHAEGSSCIAEGGASHAEGSTTHAKGPRSHTEGYHTYAGEQSSHAEGYDSSAIGKYSHSEGYKTIANGESSHTSGLGTITSNEAEFACGKYNYTHSNILFSVGYGTSDNDRTNAFEVTRDCSVFVKRGLYHLGGKMVASDNDIPIKKVNNICAVLRDSSNNVSVTYARSIALGYNGNSLGETSFSEGYETTASGHNSHAKGERTLAFGQSSSAEGVNTISYGKGSHAEGYSSVYPDDITRKDGSTYLDVWTGKFLISEGNYSHAEGYCVIANGNYSHAEGKQTLAKGIASHAEGIGSKEYGAFANYSHVEGGYNITSDNATYAHAEGTRNTAHGYASHAEGRLNTVSGEASHIEGRENTIVGNYSHAEGFGNHIEGDYSHIEGGSNRINGNNYTHVGGYSSTAYVGSEYSFAHGYKLILCNPHEVAFGQFNESIDGIANDGEHNTLFSVGVGREGWRHNGFEIYTSNDHDGISMDEDGKVVITKCDCLMASLRIPNKVKIQLDHDKPNIIHIKTSYANMVDFTLIIKLGLSNGSTTTINVYYNTFEREYEVNTGHINPHPEDILDAYFYSSNTTCLQTAYCYYTIS